MALDKQHEFMESMETDLLILKKQRLQKQRRVIPAEEIPVPERLFLFRSCTGSLEYPGTEKAVREVLERLGIEAVMSPDQTCCTGYLLTCNALLPELALAAAARNMAIAEKMGLDVYVFCNGCFGYNTEFVHILESDPALREKINQLLEPFGWHFEGRSRIYHVQELFYRLREKLASLVVRPLTGIRVAVHYGCHYLAKKYGILDDPDYPTFLEEIIELLGGTPVFYRERRACCGAAVGRSFTHREEVSLRHACKKLLNLKEEGADVLLTVCPGCNVQLDREQPVIAERGWGEVFIPVMDFAQLVALSLGVPPQQLGFEANTVAVDALLAKLGA